MFRKKCNPECQRSMDAKEEHDSAERVATVAANLISSERYILKLDSKFTEYSAQYLVDNAEPLVQGPQRRSKITVKDCLECAFKEGIPKAEKWADLGCLSKVPPSASLIPRVPVKGEVIEAKTRLSCYSMDR